MSDGVADARLESLGGLEPLPPSTSCATSTGRLLRECWSIVFCHRGWLAAVALTSLAYALLEPVQGIVIKRVVDGLQAKQETSAEIVFAAIPNYVAVLIGLALLSFVEKCLKGFYDPQLIFALQRTYLMRRTGVNAVVDVSRLQYDCMYGRKALEIFGRDSWHILVTIGAVLGFQRAWAPEWFAPLAVLVALLAVLVLLFGVAVTRSNQAMFDAVEPVAECVHVDREHELEARQLVLYRRIQRREAWMGASEVALQLVLWLGCLATLWIMPRLHGRSGPDPGEIGGMALFVANLQIVSRPLLEIGKAYNKFCSNIPALRRTLFPAEVAVGER